MKLTEAMLTILNAMADGHQMVFSEDGDNARLWPKHPTGFLADDAVIALRDAKYIASAPNDDDNGRFGPPTIITHLGRAALAQQGGQG